MCKERSQNWCLVLYPDDETHVRCLEKLRTGGYAYAAILHNADVWDTDDENTNPEHKAGELKKPHWHIVLRYKNQVWSSPTAEALGIKENYLERCRNKDGALLYLIHWDFPNKHQYSIDEVEGCLKEELVKLISANSESERVLSILDILDSMPIPCTYRAFLTRVCELGYYGDFRRMGAGVRWLLDEHNESIYENSREY